MFKFSTVSRNANITLFNGLATHARKTHLLAENTSSRGILPSDAENAQRLNQTREEMLAKIANIPVNSAIEIDENGQEFSNAVDKAYSKALPGGFGHN